MKHLYGFLHSLLSLIFSLLVYISYYFKLTKRKLGDIFNDQPTENDIKKDIATLRNLPRHISFLVLEPEINFNILARVVVWSVAAGISYLSVYDPQGILKRKRKEFYHELLQIRQEFLGAQYEIHLSDKNNSEQSITNGTANKSARKVFVSVFSKEDGKQNIVRTAKKFCCSINNKECKSKIMNVEYFSGLLKGSDAFPDPDLALRFGPTDILNGYLPWQIRLTEFISIPSLDVMNYKLLLKTLQRYSKCEKRLGR